MVNINCGTLKEIPEVHIDVFTRTTITWETNKAFFLTHAHTDHFNGLREYFLRELWLGTQTLKYRLYMHEITFIHLKFHLKRFPNSESHCNAIEMLDSLLVRRQIIFLKKNKRYDLRFGSADNFKTCWVTPLSAGHCPGSVMLKFEVPTCPSHISFGSQTMLRILYTGDCRVSWRDLVFTQNLKIYDTVTKMDVMYIDTTFILADSEFPTRKSVFDSLYQYIQNDSVNTLPEQQNPQYMICMGGYLTHLYVALRYFYKECTTICASRNIFEFCQQVPRLQGITQYTETCSIQNKCPKKFHIQDPPTHWRGGPQRDHHFKIVLQGSTLQSEKQFSINDDGVMHYTDNLIFPGRYSTHLSPNEILMMIAVFKPEEVVPLVLPKLEGRRMGNPEEKLHQKLGELMRLAKEGKWKINNEPDFPSFEHDFTGKNLWEPEENVLNVDIFYHF